MAMSNTLQDSYDNLSQSEEVAQYPFFGRLPDNFGQKRYMCLVTKSPGPTSSLCGFQCCGLNTLLDHLSKNHNVNLKANLDYCFACGFSLQNKLEAIDHQLNHLLDLEQEDGFSEKIEPTTPGTRQLLEKLFKQWKRDKDIVQDSYLFGEHCPMEEEPQADILEDQDDHEEEEEIVF